MKGDNYSRETAGLYLALIHHPVINRKGDIITSAVTNLDLHDISRAARTYGVQKVYCITPLEDQQQLVRRLVNHWTSGYGAAHNPDRREALNLLQVTATLEEAIGHVTGAENKAPQVVATSARRQSESIDCSQLGQQLARGLPQLIMFGTAWGLAPELMKTADAILKPIEGNGEYNHLSVRSAVAIILDRLADAGKSNEKQA